MPQRISITTKTGDKGYSRLFSGEKVLKNSPRLGAYGDIDELVSILSIARHHAKRNDSKDTILEIQRALFVVASELATTPDKLKRLPQRIDSARLEDLDRKREALERKVDIPRGFVIPGNTLASAYIDHARTVARRCERRAVGLFNAGEITNDVLIVWLNRLSDFLYLLARYEEGKPLLVKEE